MLEILAQSLMIALPMNRGGMRDGRHRDPGRAISTDPTRRSRRDPLLDIPEWELR